MNVWLSEHEYDRLATAARREGLTPAGFVAVAALGVAAGELIPIPTDERAQWAALGLARLEAQRLRSHLDGWVCRAASDSAGRRMPAELGPLLQAAAAAVASLDAAAASFRPRRRHR